MSAVDYNEDLIIKEYATGWDGSLTGATYIGSVDKSKLSGCEKNYPHVVFIHREGGYLGFPVMFNDKGMSRGLDNITIANPEKMCWINLYYNTKNEEVQDGGLYFRTKEDAGIYSGNTPTHKFLNTVEIPLPPNAGYTYI